MTNVEEKIQSECYKWFWNTYIFHRQMLFHVDNNSYNAIIGAKKKALGVCKGVSDMILVLDKNVLFIEFKAPGETQKPEQKTFEIKVTQRGHLYMVVESVQEFKDLINQIIGI